MATTKLYLDMRGKALDGKGSAVIILYHNGTQTSISTGTRMSKSEWKEDNPAFVLLREKKNEIDRKITMLSFEEGFESMTAAEIKSAVVQKKQPKQVSHPLSDIFDDYLANTSLKPKTRELYEYTMRKINAFSPCVSIENINLKWLKRFDAFMAENQGLNGKAVYLRCLRTILNHARDNDIQCQYPFSKFSIKYEETRKRCIGLEKLCEFYKFPVTDTKYSMYRDYFFLMFFLIGINSKDLLLAKKSQIRNGRLEYTREKTGKKYSIKIEPEAQMLIDRYVGKGDYLLDAMDHCKHYNSFTREINEGLRMIGYVNEDENDIRTITPLIPGITTYYARHTWATLAYESGVAIDIISQALGHSMGHRTTLIYIKPDQEKVDKANRLVLDRFFTLSSQP